MSPLTKPSIVFAHGLWAPAHPDLERFYAKRMGATTYEVDSSHVAMLSKPSFVLDVIRTAASAVQGGTARTRSGG
jgi:hypothetical protein